MQPIGGKQTKAENASGASEIRQETLYAPSRVLPRFFRRPTRLMHGMTVAGLFSGMAMKTALVAALATGSLGYFVMSHPASADRIALFFAKSGFEAKKLIVTGNTSLDAKVIEAQLGITRDKSLFNIDVDEARNKILGHSWVEKVTVKKVYPDTIVVDIVEKEPVALWKSAGIVHLISRNGAIIGEARPQHMLLPQVVGEGANQAAAEFLSVMNRYPMIAARSDAYVRVAGRRWNLVLEDGPKVLLPEKDWKAALGELYNLQSRKELLNRDIVQIDMRLADRLVIKLRPDVAEVRKTRIEQAMKSKGHQT